MTPNPRRPGFRLPWSSEQEGAESGAEAAEAMTQPGPEHEPEQPPRAATASTPPIDPIEVATVPRNPERTTSPPVPDHAAPVEPAAAAVSAEAPESFLRDLVAAMRRVADEARDAGLGELRANADEAARQLEVAAEQRRADLRDRAEADVAAVGEWAQAEAERIRREAESRVAARRAQLDEQLAAENRRTEIEGKALRERVAEYERELATYHAQLAEIHDPAAFAAAAKRMPMPPSLTAGAAPRVVTSPAPSAPPAAPSRNGAGTVSAASVTAETVDVHPAEEEVLAVRLAELDAALDPEASSGAAAAASGPAETSPSEEPTTTDVVVKGLGSFGAITGFRQSLAGVSGIDGVALSLGSSGEFIFRTTHRPSVDVGSAITALEGEGAKVDRRSDGTLAVTLDRAR